MSIRWPDRDRLPTETVRALFERLPAEELANRLGVSDALVASWRTSGVPAGHHAALLRYIAADNRIDLVEAATTHCLICGDEGAVSVGSSTACERCAHDPLTALELRGFTTKIDDGGDITSVEIVAPNAFEFPVHARFSRGDRHSGSTATSDPEVGHEVFDDAVHIETDDYEALFDTMQHPRRRELVQRIVQRGSVDLNVDTLVVSYASILRTVVPDGYRQAYVVEALPMHKHRTRLTTALLAWSLVHERSPHR